MTMQPASPDADAAPTKGPSVPPPAAAAATISNADLYDADAEAMKPSKLSETRRAAIRARWESVREEHDRWLLPFTDLKIDRALQYLEDLRRITEEGSAIINERINGQRGIKCEWCKKSVEGLRPSGMPKWIATMVVKTIKDPMIQRRIYFDSEDCHNRYVRKVGGGMGTDAK